MGIINMNRLASVARFVNKTRFR